MTNTAYHLKVILLAAGKSERFNGVKLLAKLTPQNTSITLIEHALTEISTALNKVNMNAKNMHVATGRYHAEISEKAAKIYTFDFCKDADLGLGHTISQSVKNVTSQNKNVSHIMIALADQVALVADDYLALIQQFFALPNKLVCAKAGQEIMPPAIFPAAYFSELMALKGDKGAKPILYANIENLETVNITHAERDIDTQQDLASWYKDK